MFDKFKKIFKFDPDREEKLRNEIEENGGIEKKDMPAMILSAYLTIIPIVIGILLLFALVAYLYVN